MKFSVIALASVLCIAPVTTAQDLGSIFGKDKKDQESEEKKSGFGFKVPGVELPIQIPGFGVDILQEVQGGISSAFQDPNPDRNTVRQYSRQKQYILTGAVVGALVTVSANCAKNKIQSKDCFNNAAAAGLVGAGLGAATGWYTASKENDYSKQADELETQIAAAELEFVEAEKATEAARRLVDLRLDTLAHLRADFESGKIEKKKLDAELREAREDEKTLEFTIKRMEGQKATMREDLATLNDPNAIARLNVVIEGLDQQLAEQDGQLNRLSGSIGLG